MSKKFAVRFLGVTRAATRRAAALLGTLRGPTGTWRQVQVRAPTGEDLPFYLPEDQSPRMVRQSVLSRRLVRCLREVVRDRMQFFFRDDFVLMARGGAGDL